MKTLITYIESLEQLKLFRSHRGSLENAEYIVGCHELSRYTNTTLTDLQNIIAYAAIEKMPLVLEWDALNQEEKFTKTCDLFDRLPLHEFKAVRLQDPGAVHFVKNKYPWLSIQLILENGNHNLVGLTRWSDYLGAQCSRLILSNELSKEMLKDYASVLKIPLEIQVYGRILLFYSPRSLLSPLEKENVTKNWMEAFGSSEESPHTGFPLIENRHGTFMFNVKDLYLLDHLDELSEMGIAHTRVDLRFDQTFEKFYQSVSSFYQGLKKESDLDFKTSPIRPLIKGFYNINKTDVLFTKLKNKRTQRQDLNYLGEIVDVERDCQLALMIKSPSMNFDQLTLLAVKMITPEGKEKSVTVEWIKNASGESVTTTTKNDIVLIPYVNGVTVKTQVYLNSKT